MQAGNVYTRSKPPAPVSGAQRKHKVRKREQHHGRKNANRKVLLKNIKICILAQFYFKLTFSFLLVLAICFIQE